MLESLEGRLVCFTRLDRLDENKLEVCICAAQIFKGQFELLNIHTASSHQRYSGSIKPIRFDSLKAEQSWIL